MNQSKIDLTEMFAEHIADLGLLESSNMCEGFAEELAQIINENLPENVEMTGSEWDSLMAHLETFVEDDLSDDAVAMVREWNEEARDYEKSREEAMYG